MESSQDKIPTWVGRAVTTAEFSTSAAAIEANKLDETSTTGATDAAAETAHKPEVDVDGPVDNPRSQPPSKMLSRPQTPDSVSGQLPIGAIIGVVVALGALALAALFLLTRSSGEDVSANQSADTSAESPSSEQSSPTDEGSSAASSVTDTADGTDEALTVDTNDATDVELDEFGATTTPLIPNVSEQVLLDHERTALAANQPAWAIYTDGRIYLLGSLPDRAIADQLTDRLQSLLGIGNVVERFTIDADAPSPTDPPLFIKETVVFAPDSANMPPGSDWILVIADVLLNRFPTTELTIVANSTDDGDAAASNLQLERAEAIVSYLSDRGIDAERLGYEHRTGIDDAVVEGSKPIEFIVRGLASTTD